MNKQILTREQWLEERKTGLGGSESAAVMGLSRWATPLDVFQQKLGIGQPKTATEQMDIGTDAQPLIAQRYAKRTGVKVDLIPNDNPLLVRHPKHAFMLASPDALIGDGSKGLELKMVSENAFSAMNDGQRDWGEDGTDEVPMYYLIQVQHYMLVTGISEWDLAALVGGRALHVYNFKADADVHAGILNACGLFWKENITKRVAPDATSAEDYAKFLGARWQKTSGNILNVSAQQLVLERITALRSAREQVAGAESALEMAENAVKEIIADADGIEWVDDASSTSQRITWKRSKDSAKVDWEGLARLLGAKKEQIEAYSTPRPGSRRLIVPRVWSKESNDGE